MWPCRRAESNSAFQQIRQRQGDDAGGGVQVRGADAFVGAVYSYTLTALNNAGPVTWTSANLPPGSDRS